MPPPFRQPSQTGASAATKRAFKPPSKANASSSSTSTTQNPAQRPTGFTSSKAALASGTSNPAAWSTTAPRAGGFQSAARLNDEDLAMVIDSDDDDDDFSAALANAKRPATVTAEPSNKRQKTIPQRLPSLSPISSAEPPRQPSPAAPANPAAEIGSSNDDIPLLPAPLLTRLLHESFEDKSVKVGKEANGLLARYLDLFVREAVARSEMAARERKEAREAGGVQDEAEVWLDVQDLEEVASGLVLDF